jgi:glycosyltransferase involved in cell wall biosynthesis
VLQFLKGIKKVDDMKTIPSSNLSQRPWVYVISHVDHSLAMEWFFRDLRIRHHDVSIIFLHPFKPALQNACSILGYKTIWIKYSGKGDLMSAFLKLFRSIKKINPELVHTHLFDASLLGLTVSRLLGVKRRIHTRHHATHHHQYFPHAVKYDRWINFLSTKIFAISESIKNILIKEEGVQSDKILTVHHGFDFDFFTEPGDRRINELKAKYNITDNYPVIGMVSRYTHWKGIQYVIPAFQSLLKEYPNALLVLANASGDYESEIHNLLSSIPLSSYREIKFEKDSPALFNLFNIFIHVPVDNHSEAFGQVYVEALASECPCIFTISGIASEFVIHEKNALIVPYADSSAIYMAMIKLLTNKELAERLAVEGAKNVREKFDLSLMIDQTLKGYE